MSNQFRQLSRAALAIIGELIGISALFLGLWGIMLMIIRWIA
ncbi:MAG: hypothetical protein ACYTBJ_17750 [Planctomycetota bacterium]